MNILDGRRAVPGDLVECINQDWVHVAGNPEFPKIGDRFTVKECIEPGVNIWLFGEDKPRKLQDKHLVFNEQITAVYIAFRFKIIPEDQKAKENITFRTKEKV